MSRFINPVPQFWLDNGTVASSGKMEFYENGDYSTLKNTYADSAMDTANTNPVNLDGQGRMPPCFGEGLYSVKLFAYDNTQPGGKGTLQWTRDDVDLSGGGAGAFDDWSAVTTYALGAAVKDNAKYYLLYGLATSLGQRPSTSPAIWEEITFLTVYNENKTYSEDEIVVYGGFIYRSLEDDNDDTPPSAKWANLTFNDSVAGNFTAGGDIIVGGNLNLGGIDINYYEDDLAANGSFSSGSIKCTRIGRLVTISSESLVHLSMSTASSAPGLIPAQYRPAGTVPNSYEASVSPGFIATVLVLADGQLTTRYVNYSGTLFSREGSGRFSISYNV